MKQYQVTQRYRAGRFAWDKGQIVSLSDDDAEWVNRDAPGTLRPYKPRAKRQDRMVREAQHER